MSKVVTVENQDDIVLIKISNPPVNAISQAVRAGIISALEEAIDDEDIKAIILSAEGKIFSSGNDINEFDGDILEPDMNVLISSLEQSPKLTIAAINGLALGGALEIAMGCHYRCAATSAKLGLPEVKLGLLPGAGGTQRLPRLTGVKRALDIIISGNPLSAKDAADAGIVDRLIENDFLAGALIYTRELLSSNAAVRRTSELEVDIAELSEDFFLEYEKSIVAQTQGLFSPGKIIESVRASAEVSFAQGLQHERELFMQCMDSIQSKSLRHVFFAERMTNKVPDLAEDVIAGTIRSVGIVGAGTMGGGIAMNFVNVGIPVTLLETTEEALERGLGIIRSNYERSMKKGRLTQAQLDDRMAMINGTLDYADLSDVDMAIEAVFENMEIKKTVFAELDNVCKQDAILATNTSTLDVNEIAAVTRRPESVIGLHFFSPANVMRLLEVVRGEKTSDEVIMTSMAMAKKIHKVPALVGVCFGFVGNRMFEPYGREMQMLLLEGATPEQIDNALTDFGMAMGPCSVYDLAGIDVAYKVLKERTDVPDDERYSWAFIDLFEMGRYGQKTGQGFYTYDKETRKRSSDPEILTILKNKAEYFGISQRKISDDEIVARCVYPLINEAALILEEGIASRPSDVDIIWINGYGFPALRGGPMFYADTIGLDNVYRKICEYRDELSELYWTPAPLLEQLVKEGKTFSDLNNK